MESEMIKNGEKAISFWKVIVKNKLIFCTIYYSILLFYSQYGNRAKYQPLDYVKEILIKYNDLIVFIIVSGSVIAIILQLIASLIKNTASRDSRYSYISVLNIARKLEEIIWVLFLIIAPIAYFYNTTFVEYRFSAVMICAPFVIIYIALRFLAKKTGWELSI